MDFFINAFDEFFNIWLGFFFLMVLFFSYAALVRFFKRYT